MLLLSRLRFFDGHHTRRAGVAACLGDKKYEVAELKEEKFVSSILIDFGIILC